MPRTPVVVDALRQERHGSPGALPNRNSFMSVRSSVKNIMTSSVAEIADKPIATGGGLSCSIFLAEPTVFLTGFDHEGQASRRSNNGTALLRGTLLLNVTKNIKIRAVTLKLHGTARTEWPEGIPPLKLELYEEESLRTQALTFFHAMHESWETPYGNQCTYRLKGPTDSPASTGMTAKEIKRLSLQQVQSRSFGKGDSPLAHPVQAKGFKVFAPGTYEYSFELPIDHHQLESIKLPYGCVKWELQAMVERAGAFKPNLHGAKEVNIIRVPDQLSLETVEPISISRQWEDQLFYDIVISGKSFPIGGKIPIAFKLTPLAKVQLHRLKVFVTESAEYWTNNRRVTRKDPGRKILLFEKSAGKPLEDKYASSEISYMSGGELSPSERAEARATAARRRAAEAAGTRSSPMPLPEPSENLLGDLDLGLEAYWGATEIEMNVQIPTCDQMAKNPMLRLHPDCSWRNANVYHWIKVVMRISRLDADDPEGKRRRHFEISIDSPFTILSCLATQANTALPQYSGINPSVVAQHRASATCGCHDAPSTPTPASRTTSFDLSLGTQQQHMPMPPQAAHLQAQQVDTPGGDSRSMTDGPASDSQDRQRTAHSDQEGFENPRPIHLLRVPSFAPPAFDADDSPPIPMDITTPPPNYDAIIGTPSVDGLADYFSRLATYEHPDAVIEDDSDSDSDNMHMPTRIASRGGRVNVRTPGARHGPSRSMDIERPTVPIHLSMASVLRRTAE
ncbi:arrestin domain containing protein [Grosmannia clavigera kw1407]|uniref:Arrestin domain containing protein n=1 Tax=Grosmannia clavigera (strain kw1407 / UAMH 11150) TaxID=655863 RepID=F0XR38_GROCL|nr:arrestin domain containing protein [Grosmannia clavigera kw1407]EFW99828.1 arrestin domain containing protein [Grosmannia clavigera kw1407]